MGDQSIVDKTMRSVFGKLPSFFVLLNRKLRFQPALLPFIHARTSLTEVLFKNSFEVNQYVCMYVQFIIRYLVSVSVGNIPYEVSEEKLKEIFSEVGPVLSFKFVRSRQILTRNEFGNNDRWPKSIIYSKNNNTSKTNQNFQSMPTLPMLGTGVRKPGNTRFLTYIMMTRVAEVIFLRKMNRTKG